MTGIRVFAFVGVGLAIVGAVGAGVVRFVSPAPFIGGFGFNSATMTGYAIQGVMWATIGALLIVRRPDNSVGWLMVPLGVGYALSQLTVAVTFSFAAEGNPQSDRFAQIAGWVTVLLQLVTMLQFAIGFVFPSGRVQSRAWRMVMGGFWVFAVAFAVISLIQPGPLQLIPALDNPFGFGPDLRDGRPIAPILSLAAVIVLVSLVISMTSRYRSAGRVERQQQKWFVLALGVSAIGLGVTSLEAVFHDNPADAIGLTVYVFASALVPIAIGIAITRYHLYAIDRLISRTIAYVIVTGSIAIVFVGSFALLSASLARVAEASSMAVAGSTLIAFAIVQPVMRRVRRAVDRRFDRARYDAERTAAAFSGRLRHEVDIEAVAGDLIATTHAAVAPVTLGMWVRPRARRHP